MKSWPSNYSQHARQPYYCYRLLRDEVNVVRESNPTDGQWSVESQQTITLQLNIAKRSQSYWMHRKRFSGTFINDNIVSALESTWECNHSYEQINFVLRVSDVNVSKVFNENFCKFLHAEKKVNLLNSKQKIIYK